jgi:Ca-activated chloride channel family protein
MAMSFRWPFLLWALLLIPVAVAAYAGLEWRRVRAARRFATPAMLPNVMPSIGGRRYLVAALQLAALVVLITSVARPQIASSVPRERTSVVLVMDSSDSMTETDIAPSRLEAARRAAKLLLDELPPGFPVGVVSFDRKARILNAPTIDRNAVRTALDSLETHVGTAIGDGLTRALELPTGESAGRRPAPVLLLLSDGNNTTGEVAPLDAAERARKRGVRIHTVSLGAMASSDELAHATGRRPPNEAMLRAIAEATGGEYASAPSAAELAATYEDLGSSIGFVDDHLEVTAAFAGAALVLLAAAGILSARWFSRVP